MSEVHVHKHTAEVETVDLDAERSLDAAIGRVIEEFGSVLSVQVTIDPRIYGETKVDVRTYHRVSESGSNVEREEGN